MEYITRNKKLILLYAILGICIFVVVLVFATNLKYPLCSDRYPVHCWHESELITEEHIPCSDNKDCSIEKMQDFCSLGGHPSLLKCAGARYYCEDDGYCKGCVCPWYSTAYWLPVEPPEREKWPAIVEQISVWQDGYERVLDSEKSGYIELGRILLPTLHKLNIQAECVFDVFSARIFGEERVQEIKRNNKVVEMVFKQADDFLIGSLVQDEKRYRILKSLKAVIFVLEDNLDEGIEGHILLGSERERKDEMCSWEITQEDMEELGPCEAEVGYYFNVDEGRCMAVSGCKFDSEIVPFKTGLQCEVTCIGQFIMAQKTPLGWSCWTIKQEDSNELDKSWIEEINKILEE